MRACLFFSIEHRRLDRLQACAERPAADPNSWVSRRSLLLPDLGQPVAVHFGIASSRRHERRRSNQHQRPLPFRELPCLQEGRRRRGSVHQDRALAARRRRRHPRHAGGDAGRPPRPVTGPQSHHQRAPPTRLRSNNAESSCRADRRRRRKALLDDLVAGNYRLCSTCWNATLPARAGYNADYVGPSIDLGFRAAPISTARQLIVSADLAWLLCQAHLGYHKPEERRLRLSPRAAAGALRRPRSSSKGIEAGSLSLIWIGPGRHRVRPRRGSPAGQRCRWPTKPAPCRGSQSLLRHLPEERQGLRTRPISPTAGISRSGESRRRSTRRCAGSKPVNGAASSSQRACPERRGTRQRAARCPDTVRRGRCQRSGGTSGPEAAQVKDDAGTSSFFLGHHAVRRCSIRGSAAFCRPRGRSWRVR